MDPLSENAVVNYGSTLGNWIKDEEEPQQRQEEGTSQENLSEDNAKKEEEEIIRKQDAQKVLNEKCNRNMKDTLMDKSFLNKLFRTALADAAYLGVVSVNVFQIITAPRRSLRRLCFYTCLSFCSQGEYLGRYTPPQAGTPSWAATPPAGTPCGRYTP